MGHKHHKVERLAPIKPLWDAKDVAAFLKTSRSWVYMQAEAGKIPHRKFGGLVRFDEDEIRAWARGEEVEVSRVSVITPLRYSK